CGFCGFCVVRGFFTRSLKADTAEIVALATRDTLPGGPIEAMADWKHPRQRDRQLAANRRLAGQRPRSGAFDAVVLFIRDQDGRQLLEEGRGIRIAEQDRDERLVHCSQSLEERHLPW